MSPIIDVSAAASQSINKSGSISRGVQVLLFDGDCGFCQRWCAWAQRRGAGQWVQFHPCQSAVELRGRAAIDERECAQSAIYVDLAADGRVINIRKGAAAINAVLARLPGKRNMLFRIAARLYPLPGIAQLEELGYRIIARNRHRLAQSSSCTVQRTPKA